MLSNIRYRTAALTIPSAEHPKVALAYSGGGTLELKWIVDEGVAARFGESSFDALQVCGGSEYPKLARLW